MYLKVQGETWVSCAVQVADSFGIRQDLLMSTAMGHAQDRRGNTMSTIAKSTAAVAAKADKAEGTAREAKAKFHLHLWNNSSAIAAELFPNGETVRTDDTQANWDLWLEAFKGDARPDHMVRFIGTTCLILDSAAVSPADDAAIAQWVKGIWGKVRNGGKVADFHAAIDGAKDGHDPLVILQDRTRKGTRGPASVTGAERTMVTGSELRESQKSEHAPVIIPTVEAIAELADNDAGAALAEAMRVTFEGLALLMAAVPGSPITKSEATALESRVLTVQAMIAEALAA
jgi:hypothetical protein